MKFIFWSRSFLQVMTMEQQSSSIDSIRSNGIVASNSQQEVLLHQSVQETFSFAQNRVHFDAECSRWKFRSSYFGFLSPFWRHEGLQRVACKLIFGAVFAWWPVPINFQVLWQRRWQHHEHHVLCDDYTLVNQIKMKSRYHHHRITHECNCACCMIQS